MILSPDLHDIERTAQSDAERRVARLLHAIPSSEAVAFHSVKLRSHQYKQMAEADFVVLWKGVVVVVEVKGGGVKKFEGVWYSIDRNRDSHRLSTSPMEQARSAMFALKDILREDGVGWFAAEAVVITPDTEAPPAATEWKRTHWLAKESMSAVVLEEALDTVVAASPAAPHGSRRARADELRNRLFGEFTRLPVVDAQRGAIIDEQNLATADQARVLAGLAKNERLVVLGGAGTGKSVVLAEAAKQEAEAGRSVLITFRSRGLLDFFAPRVAGRAIDVVPFDDLDASRVYDVVLVDEAQDLMSADAMDLIDRVVVGARSGGRWRMFLDPNNQAHIHGAFDPEVFELIGCRRHGVRPDPERPEHTRDSSHGAGVLGLRRRRSRDRERGTHPVALDRRRRHRKRRSLARGLTQDERRARIGHLGNSRDGGGGFRPLSRWDSSPEPTSREGTRVRARDRLCAPERLRRRSIVCVLRVRHSSACSPARRGYRRRQEEIAVLGADREGS